MNFFLIILLIIAGIAALLMILALFIKKEHYVKREIIINAPRQEIFDYVKLLKNQDTFNNRAMTDSERVKEYKGTDGEVGFVYSWKGNKAAGEGEKEIMNLAEGKRVEAEIRFVKPMKTSAYIIMELESVTDDQTKVTWSNAGTLHYPFNLLVPMMEKMVPKDMDKSLLSLKNILENK